MSRLPVETRDKQLTGCTKLMLSTPQKLTMDKKGLHVLHYAHPTYLLRNLKLEQVSRG